jgi:NAD(P)-dependent dehydrogenase (short-subunit alcohol dehydrogenase family)
LLATLIDQLLEITVVGSFSRIGFDVRSRLFAWPAPTAEALAGRTILLTGATSGLGREAARQLAVLGARVVLLGRDEAKLAAVRDDLVRSYQEDRFPTVVADMSSLESVHRAVERVASTEPRLDGLIDNAGAMFRTRQTSPDGIEATVATTVTGPFVLVAGLLPLLRSSRVARVVSVTSGGQYAQRLDLDDLQSSAEPFDGVRAYARAKRAQVCLMREWSRRIPRGDIAFSSMHPGWADTPGVATALPVFHRIMGPILRTPAQGADTMVWLATEPRASGLAGRLVLDRRARPFDRIPSTRVTPIDRRRLWDAVVRLTGVSDPAPEQVLGAWS